MFSVCKIDRLNRPRVLQRLHQQRAMDHPPRASKALWSCEISCSCGSSRVFDSDAVDEGEGRRVRVGAAFPSSARLEWVHVLECFKHDEAPLDSRILRHEFLFRHVQEALLTRGCRSSTSVAVVAK
jgi:hypothetical protein